MKNKHIILSGFVFILLISGCAGADNPSPPPAGESQPSGQAQPSESPIPGAPDEDGLFEEISGLGEDDYAGMFELSTKTDGAYAELLGYKLAGAFEADAEGFIGALSPYGEEIQSAAIALLVGEFIIDDTGDYERAKKFGAKLALLRDEPDIDQDVLTLMADMLNRYAEINGLGDKLGVSLP